MPQDDWFSQFPTIGGGDDFFDQFPEVEEDLNFSHLKPSRKPILPPDSKLVTDQFGGELNLNEIRRKIRANPSIEQVGGEHGFDYSFEEPTYRNKPVSSPSDYDYEQLRAPNTSDQWIAGALGVVPAIGLGLIGGGLTGGAGAAPFGMAGAGIGSKLKQKYEIEQGLRRDYNPGVTAIDTLLGGFTGLTQYPGAQAGVGQLAKYLGKNALEGAAVNTVSTPFYNAAEGQNLFDLGQLGQSAKIGAMFGAGTAGIPIALNRFGRRGASTVRPEVDQIRRIAETPPPDVTPLDPNNLPERIVFSKEFPANVDNVGYYRRLGYVSDKAFRENGFPVMIRKDIYDALPPNQKSGIEQPPKNQQRVFGKEELFPEEDGTYVITGLDRRRLEYITSDEGPFVLLNHDKTTNTAHLAPKGHPAALLNQEGNISPAPGSQSPLGRAMAIIRDYDPTADVTQMSEDQIIDMAESIAGNLEIPAAPRPVTPPQPPFMEAPPSPTFEPAPPSQLPSFLQPGVESPIPNPPRPESLGVNYPFPEGHIPPFLQHNRLENIASQPPVRPGELDLPLNQAPVEQMNIRQLDDELLGPNRQAALQELQRRYPNTIIRELVRMIQGNQGGSDIELRIIQWAVNKFRALMGREPAPAELQAEVNVVKQALGPQPGEPKGRVASFLDFKIQQALNEAAQESAAAGPEWAPPPPIPPSGGQQLSMTLGPEYPRPVFPEDVPAPPPPGGMGNLMPMAASEGGMPVDADLARIQAQHEANILSRTPMRSPEQISMGPQMQDAELAAYLRQEDVVTPEMRDLSAYSTEPGLGKGELAGPGKLPDTADAWFDYDPGKLYARMLELGKKMDLTPSEADELNEITRFFLAHPDMKIKGHNEWKAARDREIMSGRYFALSDEQLQAEMDALQRQWEVYPQGRAEIDARIRQVEAEINRRDAIPRPFPRGMNKQQAEARWWELKIKDLREEPLTPEELSDYNSLIQYHAREGFFNKPEEAVKKAQELGRAKRNLATFQKAIDEGKQLSISQTRIYEMLKKFIKDQTGAIPISDIAAAFRRRRRAPVPTGTFETPEGPVPIRPIRSVIEASRTSTTTWDFSAPLRQGAGLFGTAEWRAGWIPMFKAAASKEFYEQAMREIGRRREFARPISPRTGMPLPSFAERSGIKLTDLGTNLSNREENMLSLWIENRVPGVARSNRAYNMFLNKLRADTFSSLLKDAEEAGLDPRQEPELAKAIGEFVMTATGRGPLRVQGPGAIWHEGGWRPKYQTREYSFEHAAKTLSGILFAPRLQAARIRMLSPWTYTNAPPFVRKQYLKSAFSLASLWATMLTAGGLAGAKVGFDPTSADFLKIKLDDRTRIDPGIGFQQYLVAMMRLALGYTTSSGTSGKTEELGQGFRGITAGEVLQNFASNKFHPFAKFGYDMLFASKYQPVMVGDRIAQMFVPMIAQDAFELLDPLDIQRKRASIGVAAPTLTGNMFGVGSQTYERGVEESRLVPPVWDYPYQGNTLLPMRRFIRRHLP